jgi:hypothetical protein
MRTEPLRAMLRPGLASDEELNDLAQVCGPVLAVRIVLPTGGGHCGCGSDVGEGPALVALDPADAAVPEEQRAAVRLVRPGRAVADTAWAFLSGGTVALAGVDVVVARVAQLGLVPDPGPVLLALSDLATSLGRTEPAFAPLMRTVAVVGSGVGAATVDGWDAQPTAGVGVPVSTGIGRRHPHSSAHVVLA